MKQTAEEMFQEAIDGLPPQPAHVIEEMRAVYFAGMVDMAMAALTAFKNGERPVSIMMSLIAMLHEVKATAEGRLAILKAKESANAQ